MGNESLSPPHLHSFWVTCGLDFRLLVILHRGKIYYLFILKMSSEQDANAKRCVYISVSQPL